MQLLLRNRNVTTGSRKNSRKHELTLNSLTIEASTRLQYAVFHPQAVRVKGLTNLSARPNPKVRTTSALSN